LPGNAGQVLDHPITVGAGATDADGCLGLQVDQAFDGVEDLGAAPATHPAFGDTQLVLHDTEHGAAGSAAGGQTHGVMMSCPAPAAGR
jgi:hypothetical protein